MPMPEVFSDVWTIRGGSDDHVIGYEHVVGLLLPWRRYNPEAEPRVCEGSPSRLELGRSERHGTLLTISRVTFWPNLDSEAQAQMYGELAEAWALMKA